jgi:hypothetical protein
MIGLLTLPVMIVASGTFLFGADIVAKRTRADADTVRAIAATVMALASIVSAIDVTIDGSTFYRVLAIFGAAAWTWIAWASWNRRNRRRRPSRVLSKVRDLGHRLAVVPATATGSTR